MKSLKELLRNNKNYVRAPDRNPLIAPQADLAKTVKNFLNQYETKKLGKIDSPWNRYGSGHSFGDLLFGESPELLDDMSYGKNPFAVGKTGRIPVPDKRLLDMPVPIPATGGLAVIKNKGGNWLTGSVENALKELKRDPLLIHNPDAGEYIVRNGQRFERRDRNGRLIEVMEHPERPDFDPTIPYPDDAAVNSWIDNTLTKYVKNRMATPDDEVRKLADQGILHYEPDPFDNIARRNVTTERKRAGFPIDGMADNHVTGTAWEDTADWLSLPESANEYLTDFTGNPNIYNEKLLAENPWLSKVDPSTPVHTLDEAASRYLGFPHLIDELLNAANPDSGLPMNLRMKPEGFKGLSMEEAVKKVHGINAFRAEQAKKVNERFAQAEGIPVYKDYGDGTRLLEYKLPDELPKGIEVGRDGGFKLNQDYYETADEVKKKQLESWLKQEGDTMGHCVGGYCDAVTSGQSRILSLRDKDGKSRATIELRPEKKINSPFDYLDQNHVDYLNKNYDLSSDKLTTKDINEILSNDPLWLKYKSNPTPVSISQIKGPGNRAPDPDVLPYLQDFVKSGNWSNVSDLDMVGMKQFNGGYATPDEIRETIVNDSAFKDWYRSQNTYDPPSYGRDALTDQDLMRVYNQFIRDTELDGGI